MDRYDVIVQGLDDRADPVAAEEGVARVIGGDRDAAARLLAALPATIREDLSERDAEAVLHALRAAGVRVRLKKKSASRAMVRATNAPPSSPPGPEPEGASVRPRTPPRDVAPIELDAPVLPIPDLPIPDLPLPTDTADAIDRTGTAPRPAGEQYAPRPAATAAPIAPEPANDDVEPPRFWSALPTALIYPLRGPGWKWLLVGALLSPIVPIAATIGAFMRFYGLVIVGAAAAVFLGYVLAWFRACCFGTMTGEREPEGLPEHWRDRFQEGGFVAIVLMSASMLGFVALATAARGTLDVGHPGTHLVALFVFYGLLFCYWPIGIGLLVARQSMLAFFDFAVAMRALVEVPLQMLAVLVICVVAQAIAASVIFWLTVAAASISAWGWLVALALGALPFAYVHAVMGSAMGYLFRVRPHVFM